MKARYFFMSSIIILVSSCVTVPPMQLKTGAEKVQVAKSDPKDNYKIIGPVSGFDGQGCGGFGYLGSYERAITNLRNKTFKQGGDYAQLISLIRASFKRGLL